jgi:glutathione peroxidase
MRRLLSALAAVPMLFAAREVHAQTAQTGSAADFSFVAIDGTPMPLSAYAGKVLLVVNVASFCGFTKQYAGLQALWQTYEAKGLVVIGVPTNDFGEQEPGSNAEIKTFCEGAFNITFPLAEKAVVKGSSAHPFYRWARDTLGDGAVPRWNFHKYLIGRDGKLLSAFSTQVEPQAPQVIKAIELALATQADTHENGPGR